MVFDAENVAPWKKDESPRSPQPVPRKPHIHKKASFHKLPVKYEECSAGNFVCKNVNQCIPSKYNVFLWLLLTIHFQSKMQYFASIWRQVDRNTQWRRSCTYDQSIFIDYKSTNCRWLQYSWFLAMECFKLIQLL